MWSKWTLFKHGICNKNCEKYLVYQRFCNKTTPSPEKLSCPGNSTMETTEPCTGYNCGRFSLLTVSSVFMFYCRNAWL